MDIIIKGRSRDLGGFTVVRSIPSAKRRQVGPFVFLDHMGPMRIDETHLLDVRPHPHIGLATVTYLLEGRGHHRDSLGYSQVIEPGAINWMTAGRGIVHSERTPEEDKNPALKNSIHGIQVWVGLPKDQEDCEPSFAHYPKEEIPAIEVTKNLKGKLMIGEHNGVKSPVKTMSPTFFLEFKSDEEGSDILSFKEQEIGIFLIGGEATINGQELELDDIIIVADPKNIKIEYSKGASFVVIGGEPFPEPRYIWWNFISSEKEKIHAAAKLWEEQKMGKVEGEIDFIPLPKDPLP